MTTMQALAATKFGDFKNVLSLREVPCARCMAQEQPLGPFELLVKVAWSDVNPVDLQKLHGGVRNNGVSVDPAFVPGFAGSGTVVRMPSCAQQDNTNNMKELSEGTRVAFLLNPSLAPARNGSYASYCIVDKRAVAVIPHNVSLRDAACVPLAGCTAFESLRKLGLAAAPADQNVRARPSTNTTASHFKEKPRRRLLIIGAAGGVGSWAIRLARAWHPDLEIIGTTSSTASNDWCLAGGASKCIPHDEIEGNQHNNNNNDMKGGPSGSVDAILCLTEPTPAVMHAMAQVIRPYGRICLVVAGPSINAIDLSFVFFKSATVSCETVFSCFRTEFSAEIGPAEEMTDILSLLAIGKIESPLSPLLRTNIDGDDQNGSFEDWQNAMSSGGLLESLQGGHVNGKLVMRVGGEETQASK